MAKLVRDGIPEKIRANGENPVVRYVQDDDEYVRFLYDKLLEETQEVIAADGYAIAEEGGDLLEVLEALLQLHGMSLNEALIAKRKKRESRGGFNLRAVLERVLSPKQ